MMPCGPAGRPVAPRQGPGLAAMALAWCEDIAVATSSFPRGVTFGTEAQQLLPAGASATRSDRPRNSRRPAAASDNSRTAGPLQNGYPVADPPLSADR